MKRFLVVLGSLVLLLRGGGKVGATLLTFHLDTAYSGGPPPVGPAPWTTATFDDSFGVPAMVRLTMATPNLVDDEFVSRCYFNVNSALNLSLLSIAPVNTSAVNPGSVTAGRSTDAFRADGDELYDILFRFPVTGTGGGARRFTSGESIVFDFTYSTGGGHGPFLSAVQIQGIGAGANGSGWVAPGELSAGVPEAAATVLLGLGLLGLGGFRLLKEKYARA